MAKNIPTQYRYAKVFVNGDYLSRRQQLKHNGPAIWGGCVTRRSIRAWSLYFSREAVTVQGGYGVLFAVMVQILLRAGAVAVQV
jgi:hypothetical protein